MGCRSGASPPATQLVPRIVVPSQISARPRSGQLDGAHLHAGFRRARRMFDRHAPGLTALDAALGDGDHGDNMALGFRAVDELLETLPANTPPGELLGAIGHTLVGAVGGASGPLYGTACIEAGFLAGSAAVIDPALAAEMLRAAAERLARRRPCAIRDQTNLGNPLAAAAAVFAA